MQTRTLFPILVTVFFGMLVFQSCRSPRELSYFQAADSLTYKQIPGIQPEVSRIQPNDILAITITSMDKESNEILNFANINPIPMSIFPGTQGGTGMRSQPLGYLVDALGFVELPFVGKVRVNGFTLSEAAGTIRSLVDSSLVVEPAVNVRFLNRKFSVLGEVGKTGTFNLLDDRTTLPEALAIAGDIGVYGNRERVMVIRESEGIREIARVNLRTEEIFDSPYYYIRHGDLIYVEPLREKATNTDRQVQLAPIVLSAISTTIVLFTFIINVFK
ncbi:polysaccharide biosynthesis/export family protein [Leadbetterella sp. DM7]|uniref:polysaccharide biosynthesis/export family protein n=1 Tax=Leadbetterella sp. DM7 TaxID=3235085 RepID=UPI00349EDD6B